MRRNPLLGIGLLLVLAAPAGAGEKEAREIVDRAIKAQGGAAGLIKAQQCKRTDTGIQPQLGRDVPFVSQVTFHLPDQLRMQLELDKRIKSTLVIDGDKGWQTQGGGPAGQLPSLRVKEIREEAYVWWLTTLVPLTKPGFTLTSIADIKVDGEPAEGIKVVREGHADTKMYFLKRNGLLAKVERQSTEAGLTVDKEYLYGGYKEFDGVKMRTKEIVKVNGRKWTEFTISDYSFPTKLDADTFAKP